MALINHRNVPRSNALLDYAYGKDFRYGESITCGSGPAGWSKARRKRNARTASSICCWSAKPSTMTC
jgi:hypothetical protein